MDSQRASGRCAEKFPFYHRVFFFSKSLTAAGRPPPGHNPRPPIAVGLPSLNRTVASLFHMPAPSGGWRWRQPDVLARMRYWRDPTSQSPPSSGKFVTFTPDCGGFNNIRMGFEFAVLVAMVTRRTLVLPEPRPWYLIDFGPFTRMRPDAPRAGGVGRSSYGDFFNLTSLASIVPLIDQDAFLSREAEQRPIPAAAPAAVAAGAKAQHAGVSQIMHGDLGHDNTWGYNRQACATKQSQGSDPEPNPIPNPPALTDRCASGSVVATPARAGRTGGSARATSSARARRTPGAAPAASAPRGCGLCCLSGSPLRSLGHAGAATFGASLVASCRQLTGDHWVPIATRVSEPGRRVRDWMEVGDSAGRQCMLHSTMRLPPDWATKTVRLKGHAFCCRGPDSGFGGVPASAIKAAGFQGRVTTGVVRSNGSALSTPRLDDYVDLPWSPIDRYIAWPNVDAVEQSARADAHVRGAQRRATTAFPCHVHDTSATRPTGARKRRQARTSCKETSARSCVRRVFTANAVKQARGCRVRRDAEGGAGAESAVLQACGRRFVRHALPLLGADGVPRSQQAPETNSPHLSPDHPPSL